MDAVTWWMIIGMVTVVRSCWYFSKAASNCFFMNSQSAWCFSICSESCLSSYLSASTVTNHYKYAIFYGILVRVTGYLGFAYFWVIGNLFIRLLPSILLLLNVVFIVFKERVVKIHAPFSIPYSTGNVTFLCYSEEEHVRSSASFYAPCEVSSGS